jgi:hypothetical protein
MLTHTEIPWFMSLPWLEVCEWTGALFEVQAEDAPKEPA